MPVAIAAVEVYEGIGAYAAATGVLATVAAGAMIAGGAITLAGAATGNKQLQSDGMTIGAVGSIGTVAASISASSAATSAATDAAAPGAADTAATGAATPSELNATQTPMGANVAPTTAPPPVPAVGGAPTSLAADPTGLGAKLDAIKASQDGLAKYSMVSGVLQGAGTAYSGWAQQQATTENQQRQIAFQQQLADRANSVGDTGAIQPALAVTPGALYSGASSPGIPTATTGLPPGPSGQPVVPKQLTV